VVGSQPPRVSQTGTGTSPRWASGTRRRVIQCGQQEQDHRAGLARAGLPEQDQPPVRQPAVDLVVQLGEDPGFPQDPWPIGIRLRRIRRGQGERAGTGHRAGGQFHQRSCHVGRSPLPSDPDRCRRADPPLGRFPAPVGEHALRELVGRCGGPIPQPVEWPATLVGLCFGSAPSEPPEERRPTVREALEQGYL
jgi:hypothetical protein